MGDKLKIDCMNLISEPLSSILLSAFVSDPFYVSNTPRLASRYAALCALFLPSSTSLFKPLLVSNFDPIRRGRQ